MACVEEQQIIGQGFCLIAMGTRVDRQFRGLEKQQRPHGKGWDVNYEQSERLAHAMSSAVNRNRKSQVNKSKRFGGNSKASW